MADGVLQDVHWSMGGIGYFPTYSLGNLYSAQFFDTYIQSRPEWEADFKAGSFSHFLDWLRENIHSKGREFTASELVERITGKPLDASYALNYLNAKYRGIYGLPDPAEQRLACQCSSGEASGGSPFEKGKAKNYPRL